jgi:hypothetical protein
VQEQGREQIANALTLGPVAAVEELVNFSYYTNTPGGGWNLSTINGNKVAFWSWDVSCNNYDSNLNPPDNVESYLPPVCPYSDEVHIVSCEGNSCLHLPDAPYSDASLGSATSFTDYHEVSIANPFVSESFALTRSMYVTGMCGSSVIDGFDMGLLYSGTSFLLTDEIVMQSPTQLLSGLDVVDEIISVHLQWGDGSTVDMVLDGSYPGFYAKKTYLGISSPGGYVVKATLYGESGKAYSAEVNILVSETATTNTNDNSSAGRTYFTGQVGSTSIDDCEYKVSAYPYNSGATTQIGYDISWITNSYTPKWSEFEYSVGTKMIVPYEYSGGTSSLTHVEVKIDGVVYNLPKDTGGSVVSLGGLTFIGQCSDEFYSCNYRAYNSLMLELLPWGTGENPNCRGFTVGEIEALDFGAMDLDEWIATIVPLVPDENDIVDEALASAASKKDALLGGVRVSDGFVKAIYYDEVTAHPREEFTFQAISGFEINDDVREVFYKVVVNWGDEGNTYYDMAYTTLSGFSASKTYSRTSGAGGFDVQFAFYADSGRIYTTNVKILIGYGGNTKEVLSRLGGGSISISDFAMPQTSNSSLFDSQGVY